MKVAELIQKLRQFDSEMEVKMELTSDYRDSLYPMEENDVYEDDSENCVVICGSTESIW